MQHPRDRSFDSAMMMSIRIVFESASLGLALKVPKCSFFPRHSMKTLGTIVDLKDFSFKVSSSRVKKIHTAMENLYEATQSDWDHIPAKLVASFVGLIWSVSDSRTISFTSTNANKFVLTRKNPNR